MEIVLKKVSELIPYINNSRTHSEAQVQQIASSIREFGFTNPILIDSVNSIIAGHGRLQAAGKLKMEEVPCIRLEHLTEAQKKAYIIADNKLALNAGWDIELLNNELDNLVELGFDLDIVGFGASELELINSNKDIESLLDEYEPPEDVEYTCPSCEYHGEKKEFEK